MPRALKTLFRGKLWLLWSKPRLLENGLKTLFNGRKAMASLVKAKVTGKRIPVRVNLLVTKFCNLSVSIAMRKNSIFRSTI